MDQSAIRHYKAIGQVQLAIANATTLDEAVRAGLKIIIEQCGASMAVLWYLDRDGDGQLHPYYWICPHDLTAVTHRPGEGIVGRTFTSGASERLLDFKACDLPADDVGLPDVDITSLVCVPVSNSHETLGCLEFINRSDGGPFSDEDADTCEIMAMMAAIALDESDLTLRPWTPGTTIMSLRDITRDFTNGSIVTKVLKGVNLDVYEGELLVLLGESGCGKSTLLNIVGGMDEASSGSFTFMGRDYSTASRAELTELRRDYIGFIFQSYNLMPNLTASQNLRLIGELVDDPLDSDEALEIVGLGDRKTSYPSQLSGGQQQRVSVARALVKNPKVILADEPTAALDYATSIEVLSLLEKVVRDGATLVMVTHNEEITRMADRVVRMRDGRMYEVVVNRRPAHATDLVW
ncbi:MAG: ATP-binding cassette domain-containing protein [Atopobiaceae bacterium]|jgi:ABC-type lipoprotein export system ATPase subunit|nr:ATP-binding cassette domain-containing protein [Atopobiaceae bacterium]MCH4181154.1 ATP-binding cassette domain-containing protein [Atopobiaceae bacterium]MCH4214812.1 ATP-binding cassette domain-containing protein [Atopobiaceae bacterium]MCH4230232.1 ATP-binding cassette domain-containing protein [Atopobiaceae bacterium]MCH4276800.1 ATP-binding cassette domain-containing protein [Atopobiaceae bacterium]